jgi:hypothetical protein
MSFYVYENWTHDRARVHRADCSYCQQGRGTHGETSDRNGKWHPPFATSEEAFRKAASLRRADTKGCLHCKP